MTESIANLTEYYIRLNRRHVHFFLIHHLKHGFPYNEFFQSSCSSDHFPYTLWRTHKYHKLNTEFQIYSAL